MAFGLWGLAVGRINFGVACIAGLGMGIVVDDTVHFLNKYLRGLREYGMDPENAVRYALNSVGKALWVTSVILVLGFSVLTLSLFSFNANMGLLAAVTIVFALGADLLLLPPILILADKNRAPKN
jgi:predicted RND superfamily exporter protein